MRVRRALEITDEIIGQTAEQFPGFTDEAGMLSLDCREQFMPCNAHNHPLDCDCGWGGQWHGNVPYGDGRPTSAVAAGINIVPPSPTKSIETGIRFGNFHSLTIPNARCPVCGASVFYYQNAYGSRVFFDELGPPWPKHPCTDRRANQSWLHRGTIFIPQVAKPKHRADWLLEGWTPYETVRDPRKRGDRSILRSYLNGDYIEAAIEPGKLAGLPVVYGRIEGDKLQLSVVAGGNLAPVYLTASRHRRLFKKSAITGFPLHVEIEKRLWRELEAKAQIETILAHRFSKLKLRRH